MCVRIPGVILTKVGPRPVVGSRQLAENYQVRSPKGARLCGVTV